MCDTSPSGVNFINDLSNRTPIVDNAVVPYSSTVVDPVYLQYSMVRSLGQVR
jgi:hypothetical protein